MLREVSRDYQEFALCQGKQPQGQDGQEKPALWNLENRYLPYSYMWLDLAVLSLLFIVQWALFPKMGIQHRVICLFQAYFGVSLIHLLSQTPEKTRALVMGLGF